MVSKNPEVAEMKVEYAKETAGQLRQSVVAKAPIAIACDVHTGEDDPDLAQSGVNSTHRDRSKNAVAEAASSGGSNPRKRVRLDPPTPRSTALRNTFDDESPSVPSGGRGRDGGSGGRARDFVSRGRDDDEYDFGSVGRAMGLGGSVSRAPGAGASIGRAPGAGGLVDASGGSIGVAPRRGKSVYQKRKVGFPPLTAFVPVCR
jgi:hypothetical protein